MTAEVTFSDDFTITCGVVLVKKSSKTACLLYRGSEEREEYILPKGRKQIDKTLTATAVDETFKETGYHCTILPLTMPTRATPQVQIGHTPDRAETESNCTEPMAMTTRNTDDGLKLTFWFCAELDEDQEQDLTTNISCEKFNAQFFPFEQAAQLLTMDHERSIVEKAAQLYDTTFKH